MWTRSEDGKYPIGGGKPFKTVDSFVSYAGWAIKQHAIKDLFFCLSLQREVGTTSKGKLKGKKSAAAALALKAIWLDIDVGKEGAYATIEEALKAVISFREKHALPPFSAIVGSGGGIHVYWISKTAMTPDEWRPYAEGLKALAAADLKCDLGVNHKLATPRPCQLVNVPLVMYDFPTQLGSLSQIPPLSSANPTTYTHSVFADGANMDSFKQKPILAADPNDKLDAGIDKFADNAARPSSDLQGVRLLPAGAREPRQGLRPAALDVFSPWRNIHGGRPCLRSRNLQGPCDIYPA
jgi:hypothetical protein